MIENKVYFLDFRSDMEPDPLFRETAPRIGIRNIVINSDSDPDSADLNETDPGSKKSAKIMENFNKNQQKSLEFEYQTFFSQNY